MLRHFRVVSPQEPVHAVRERVHALVRVVQCLHEALLNLHHQLAEDPEGICLCELRLRGHDPEHYGRDLVHALDVAHAGIQPCVHEEQRDEACACLGRPEVGGVLMRAVHVVLHLLEEVLRLVQRGVTPGLAAPGMHGEVLTDFEELGLVARVERALLGVNGIPVLLVRQRQVAQQHLPDQWTEVAAIGDAAEAQRPQERICAVLRASPQRRLQELLALCGANLSTELGQGLL
mmetsp:Transcript_33031/g.103007  ORF Transcript_33031/g.103007 Transcript_33031/m.103007 type:complete len:233 (-) Transcript_33031:329-1027(-)